MSETEEIYDFQLIEFVKKGPKGKIRDIDCIPSTWVTFNSKKGKLETRFPEPPYNEKDNKLLRTLVKDKVAPPLGWPSYTIILRGHARTYEEAEKRLDILRTESYAYTTDTETVPEKKAFNLTKQFRTKRILLSDETRVALKVPRIDENNEKLQDRRAISTSTEYVKGSKDMDEENEPSVVQKAQKVKQIKQNKIRPMKSDVTVFKDSYGTDESSVQNHFKKSNCVNTEESLITEEELVALQVSHINRNGEKLNDRSVFSAEDGNVSDSSDLVEEDGFSSIQNTHITPNKTHSKKSDITITKDTEKSAVHNPSKKSDTVIDKNSQKNEYRSLLTTVRNLSVDIKEIAANQRTILAILQESKGNNNIADNFISKYNLDLPFKNKEEFDEFNEKLAKDELFRKEFISSLYTLLDREGVLSKSLTSILKKYLARDVALQYTTIKQMPGKTIIKGTLFFDSILGVVTSTHTDIATKLPIKEHQFCQAFGKVLANAKDWEGHRLMRTRVDLGNLENAEFVIQ